MQFWSAEQLAIEIIRPQGNSEVVVPHPFALVGALAKADVRVTGQGVQKRDLLLIATGGKLICRRLEAPLPESHRELRPDDWLELGEVRLRSRIVPSAADLQREGSFPANSEVKSRIPVLRVRHKRRPSFNRRLYAEVQLVGRSPDCEVEVHCPQASLYHCALVRDSNGLFCIDLGSGNGTYLDGQRIDCALVEMGGRLKVGDFELEFQRFSRRSASASSLGENAGGSNLSLGLPSLAADIQAETVWRGSNIGVEASDSTFSSKIIDSTAEVIPPTLSGLTIQPTVSAGDLQSLTAKQAELMSEQTDLQRGMAALAKENARLRSTQEALSQQLSQQLEEQRAALVAELKQSQADGQALSIDLLGRLEELRQCQASEASTRIDAQLQSLSQELLARLEAQGKSQTDRLLAQVGAQRQVISDELLQRVDDLAKTQAQQLKLQSDAQRHALTQELARRLEAELEGRVQQTEMASDPGQQVIGQQWLQRLDDLRSAQSEEIALAVAAQGHAQSRELMQRLEKLHEAQGQKLASQIEQQRQLLSQELARRLESHAAPAYELLAKSASQRQEALQKVQAQQLADQIEQQRQSLFQELSRQLETQAAQSRELLTKSEIRRQEELHRIQTKQLAAQSDQQRQSLSQDVLSQMGSQRTALFKEQQSYVDALNQRLAPLLASLEQLVSQQSQLSSALAGQAEQIHATRRALLDLQARLDQQVISASQKEDDAPVFELDDSEPSSGIASLDSNIHEANELASNSESAVVPQPMFAIAGSVEHAPVGRKAATPIPEDDRLLHFVSDRLAEIDSGRRRWIAIYWTIALGSVAILGAVSWVLWSWLSGGTSGS